ncbi:hypothetical protein DPEC_G00291120 [Dallia pectoralis]|uniref:Uncharacterized protein n=1 Tax=Dallia pectoralis TaxID=75939 RepID=A0ACC2FHQ4_DALPE|nr:hypothetical protein DPEC_G00291120 [Dallia pectoralis]
MQSMKASRTVIIPATLHYSDLKDLDVGEPKATHLPSRLKLRVIYHTKMVTRRKLHILQHTCTLLNDTPKKVHFWNYYFRLFSVLV